MGRRNNQTSKSATLTIDSATEDHPPAAQPGTASAQHDAKAPDNRGHVPAYVPPPAKNDFAPPEQPTTHHLDQPPAAPAHPDAPPKPDRSAEPPLLFEVGWEVCWQLGGIYTVLRSKAPAMLARWGERYTLVGPYNPKTAAIDFEATEPEGLLKDAIERLRNRGIVAHHGRWLIQGRPRVILLDQNSWSLNNDEIVYLLWKDHGIEIDRADAEVMAVARLGFACAALFQELADLSHGRPIIGHFHEWMAGVAVPRIAHMRLPVRTVFTTHATLLGRYLAGDNPYFYDHLGFVNPDAEAKHFNIYPRYQIEKAAAHASNVFTTVSEVTSLEAEKLLGRTPDMVLPNGINTQRFAATHEHQNLHTKFKDRIHDFVRGHFFPSYTFDLDNTIYLVTSGRYEYRNKGMDLFIEALYRLNQRLKEWSTTPPNIVAFIITKAPVKNINVRTLQSQTMYEDLRQTTVEIRNQMGAALFESATKGHLPTLDELLSDDNKVRLKRTITAMKSPELPTIVTHDMVNDAADPVLTHLRHRGMFNSPHDPVKIVFHPDFVTATSPLIGLDYEQFVRGCHMGVFPSYYEPWGYTPLECVALGIPAVTTDLSGFGAYVQKNIELAAMNGIMIVRRRGRSFDSVVDDLVEHLVQFCRMNRRQRIDQRNRVERMSELFDWGTLGRFYHDAHDLALNQAHAPTPGKLEIVMI